MKKKIIFFHHSGNLGGAPKNLWYLLKELDKNIYDPLKKEVTYLESPAATSADEFLIECAKKEKCYIVSNDTFRDWKRKDPWIAENIDRLRIPFMIVQGKATLSIEDIHEKTAS